MIVNILQLAMLIHVITRSQAYGWIMALMAARLLGWVFPLLSLLSIILIVIGYGITEVLGVSIQVRRFTMAHPFRMQRDISYYRRQLELNNSVESRIKLAQLLVEQNKFIEAEPLISGTLNGIYADDPALLLVWAQIQLGLGNTSLTLQTLDRLATIERLNEQALLLKAKALEVSLQTDQAVMVYRSLLGRFSGLEVKARLAQLLIKKESLSEAQALAQELLEEYKIAPSHVKRDQRPWYEMAQMVVEQTHPKR